MKKLTILTISIFISSILFTACSNKHTIKKEPRKIDNNKIKEAFQELDKELKKQ